MINVMMPFERHQTATEAPSDESVASVATLKKEICALGRELGDCSFRANGCHSLYDVLQFVYPPYELLAELRGRSDLSSALRAWLIRLEAIEGPGHRQKTEVQR